MEQIRRQRNTKTCRLLGLTGLALSVAFILNEGQARTLPMSSTIQSVNVQSTHPTEKASKMSPLENHHGFQSTKLTQRPEVETQEMDNEDNLHKKKFGLAILLLGVLAKKS